MKDRYKSTSSHTNEEYPGCLKPGFRPFDPVDLAKATERAICKGNKRMYYRFGATHDYQTGIATGYTVGCSLRCIFCWSSKTRDCLMKASIFYSPQEVFDRLTDIAQKKRLNQVRISDAESTIGKMHLLELLELVERSTLRRFVVETNGILLGNDRDYVQSLSQFRRLYVRVSLKASTPNDFTRKTGAVPEAFELPFQAIRNLKSAGINFSVSAMSADPRFMTPLERVSLIGKLAEIDPALVLNLEEEMVILYPETLKRLEAIRWDLNAGLTRRMRILKKMPGLKRFLQVAYRPISSLSHQKISRRFTIKAIRDLFHGT